MSKSFDVNCSASSLLSELDDETFMDLQRAVGGTQDLGDVPLQDQHRDQRSASISQRRSPVLVAVQRQSKRLKRERSPPTREEDDGLALVPVDVGHDVEMFEAGAESAEDDIALAQHSSTLGSASKAKEGHQNESLHPASGDKQPFDSSAKRGVADLEVDDAIMATSACYENTVPADPDPSSSEQGHSDRTTAPANGIIQQDPHEDFAIMLNGYPSANKPDHDGVSQTDTPNKPALKKSTRTSATPRSTQPKLTAKQRQFRKKVEDTTFLIANEKSPLAKIDIYAMLMRPESWTCLTANQRWKLISMLPPAHSDASLSPSHDIDADQTSNPLHAYLSKSPTIKSDIRLWKEDLLAGRFEVDWLGAANRASKRRAEGSFENFEERRIRETWGVSVDCGGGATHTEG